METGLEAGTNSGMTGGYGGYQSPFMQLQNPSDMKPAQPEGSDLGTAFGIANSGGQGALAGTASGGWIGAIVGGVIGLAEGIISAGVGSSSSQRSYNQQLQSFDNQMRYYYESANNAIEELKKRREEAKSEKAYSRRQLERKMKIENYLFGEQLQGTRRAELSQRWG